MLNMRELLLSGEEPACIPFERYVCLGGAAGECYGGSFERRHLQQHCAEPRPSRGD